MSTTLTWYGHATLGLECSGRQILIDPFFSHNPVCTVNAASLTANYILVTHGHYDHIGDTVEIAQRTGALVISNSEICRWLEKKGVKTHAQQIGGGHQHPFGYLKMTNALHSSVLPDGTHGGNAAGLLLTTNDSKKIYIAGDTGLFGDMRLIGEEGLDLAVLPIGDNYTMGPEDALRAVKLLAPRHVIPIHFGTWDIIHQDPQAWCQRVADETSTLTHILRPGQSYQLE